ncbi:hypothetical protein ES703_49844 [subsurface metagenome]
MPRPKVELAIKYLTAVQARKRLGLSRFEFDIRLERGIFPRPTYLDNTGKQYVRYFDEHWLKIAQEILDGAIQVPSVKEQRASE